VIAHGLPIDMALEQVDMGMGAERLGALVRERMRVEPRSRALFVFVGKRGHSVKILTWDGTGTIVVHKASSDVCPRCTACAGTSRTNVPVARFYVPFATQTRHPNPG
jgi:transposase